MRLLQRFVHHLLSISWRDRRKWLLSAAPLRSHMFALEHSTPSPARQPSISKTQETQDTQDPRPEEWSTFEHLEGLMLPWSPASARQQLTRKPRNTTSLVPIPMVKLPFCPQECRYYRPRTGRGNEPYHSFSLSWFPSIHDSACV